MLVLKDRTFNLYSRFLANSINIHIWMTIYMHFSIIYVTYFLCLETQNSTLWQHLEVTSGVKLAPSKWACNSFQTQSSSLIFFVHCLPGPPVNSRNQKVVVVSKWCSFCKAGLNVSPQTLMSSIKMSTEGALDYYCLSMIAPWSWNMCTQRFDNIA